MHAEKNADAAISILSGRRRLEAPKYIASAWMVMADRGRSANKWSINSDTFSSCTMPGLFTAR
jgi:hypothetical protein